MKRYEKAGLGLAKRASSTPPSLFSTLRHRLFDRGNWLRAAAALSLLIGLQMLFAPSAEADMLSTLEAPFRKAVQSGSFGFALVLIFAAGLATSLTPCVYPMIVITVSVFGARQAKSRFEGALLSTAFVLGMACLFTPLGVLAAVTGGVFGNALSSIWVAAGLALLFIALSLSMFGAFELNLPSSLRNRLAQVGGVGPKGAFALGLVSALIAAPCTGPVLAFLLTWVGTSGNLTFGAISLFIYSLGLGLLFWLVGTFAVTLPKSGRWLESIKSIFGVVMLVMAVYYLRDFLPIPRPSERNATWLGVAFGLLALGLLLGAVHLSYHEPSVGVRVRKTLGVALSVSGVMGLILWLQALPPGAKIEWLADYPAAVSQAKEAGKPLLVDFGASWCGACGELDRHTFSDPRVVAAARDFVAVRVDLSPGEVTDAKKQWLASYSQRGLPLVVLHDKAGKEVKRFTSFVDAENFLQDLNPLR